MPPPGFVPGTGGLEGRSRRLRGRQIPLTCGFAVYACHRMTLISDLMCHICATDSTLANRGSLGVRPRDPPPLPIRTGLPDSTCRCTSSAIVSEVVSSRLPRVLAVREVAMTPRWSGLLLLGPLRQHLQHELAYVVSLSQPECPLGQRGAALDVEFPDGRLDPGDGGG